MLILLDPCRVDMPRSAPCRRGTAVGRMRGWQFMPPPQFCWPSGYSAARPKTPSGFMRTATRLFPGCDTTKRKALKGLKADDSARLSLCGTDRLWNMEHGTKPARWGHEANGGTAHTPSFFCLFSSHVVAVLHWCTSSLQDAKRERER